VTNAMKMSKDTGYLYIRVKDCQSPTRAQWKTVQDCAAGTRGLRVAVSNPAYSDRWSTSVENPSKSDITKIEGQIRNRKW